jgi:dimeric dUTPase (all-alpha-NTP-PPase superfamily)
MTQFLKGRRTQMAHEAGKLKPLTWRGMDNTIRRRILDLKTVDQEVRAYEDVGSHPESECAIECIFFLQKQLEQVFYPDFMSLDPDLRSALTRKFLECLSSEIEEIRNELPWKHWKRFLKEPDEQKIQGELIDVFHFLISLMLMWGITSENLFRMFITKHSINRYRLMEQWGISPTKPTGEPQ